MTARLSIGDFSRMTQLSVKTLRHYHQVGLVAPDFVDPSTGYRYYAPGQVDTAHVVRRLRELSMPIADVRAVLASAPEERMALISSHLGRLEAQLAATRVAVESLKAILDRPAPVAGIERRWVPATRAAAIETTVDRDELVVWWQGAVGELRATVAAGGLAQTGPPGALFGSDIFEQDRGQATVFIPVEATVFAVGRVQPFTVPPAELAVIGHHGPHDNVDLAYTALGQYALDNDISMAGPLREYYVNFSWDTDDSAQWKTDLCWPISREDA
jgi:DNA-binding transcriptional MerR regulator